jgi:hypothetical protein
MGFASTHEVELKHRMFRQYPAKRSKTTKAEYGRRPRYSSAEFTSLSGLVVSRLQHQENPMRKLLMSTLLSLAWIVPALAQDAPKDHPVAPNVTPDQTDPLKDATQAIQQLIQARLASAGFTDIQMVPNSFLISARDRDGHPVTMMAAPSDIPALGNGGPDQDDGADDMPSGHPSTTGQGPLTEM